MKELKDDFNIRPGDRVYSLYVTEGSDSNYIVTIFLRRGERQIIKQTIGCRQNLMHLNSELHGIEGRVIKDVKVEDDLITVQSDECSFSINLLGSPIRMV